jgi:hypothetical protein
VAERNEPTSRAMDLPPGLRSLTAMPCRAAHAFPPRRDSRAAKLVTHSMSTDGPRHPRDEALAVRRACQISLGSNMIGVPCSTAARPTSISSLFTVPHDPVSRTPFADNGSRFSNDVICAGHGAHGVQRLVGPDSEVSHNSRVKVSAAGSRVAPLVGDDHHLYRLYRIRQQHSPVGQIPRH